MTERYAEHGLDRSAQIRALKRQLGVSEERAIAIVDGAVIASADTRQAKTVGVPAAWPLRIVVPWSALISDNRKHGAILTKVGPNQQPIPKLIMQAGYREAKAKVRQLARLAMGEAEPVGVPLQLEARVWVPDRRSRHDVANFAKCCHDALIDAVYTDDQWLHDVRWIRAGMDVDRPRAEILIAPLPDLLT